MLRSGCGRSGDTARAHVRREDRLPLLRVSFKPAGAARRSPACSGQRESVSSRTGNGSNWGTGRQSSALVVPERAVQHYPPCPNKRTRSIWEQAGSRHWCRVMRPLFLLDARPVAVVQPAGKKEGWAACADVDHSSHQRAGWARLCWAEPRSARLWGRPQNCAEGRGALQLASSPPFASARSGAGVPC